MTETTKGKGGRKPAQPIVNPDTLTGAELEAFNKKPDWAKAELRAKYALQEAKKAREAAKGTRGGGGTQKTMPAPSFTLTHSFGMLSKNQVVRPVDGSRPDAAALRFAKDFGPVAPVLVTPAEGGFYRLMDSRDFALIPEDKAVPAVVVSGFPSEEWADAAAAVYQSARGANAFGLSFLLGRLRQRGWDDKALRTRLGLKAGEIEKFEALNNLPEEIRAGVGEGRVTDSVALLVAKQTPEIRAKLAEVFRAKTVEKADARLTEGDVEEARKARTSAAVQRDQPRLGEAMASVPNSTETGGGETAPAQTAPALQAAPSPVQATAEEGQKPAAEVSPVESSAAPAAPAFVSTMPPNATAEEGRGEGVRIHLDTPPPQAPAAESSAAETPAPGPETGANP